FTLDLFDRVVAADHRRHEPGTPLDRAATARALRRAAEHLDRNPGTPLSSYVRVPSVTDTVPLLMGRSDVDTVAAQVLRLPGTAQIGPAERSRLLWADIRTRETQRDLQVTGGQQEIDRVAARVLHQAAPDPALRGAFLQFTRISAAAGRDPRSPRELAEF
ncbi:hypothetical protein, partial [Streptomyces doudnae]